MKIYNLIFIFFAFTFSNIGLTQNNKYSLWQSDSKLRGANIHPYKHFSSYSMRDAISLSDILELKQHGANLLVANYPGVFQYYPPFEIDSLHLINLDKVVDFADSLNLYLVIGIRSGPGRSLQVFDDKNREDEILFHNLEIKRKYIEMCQFIAERYKKRKSIVGYNFMLEPHADYPVRQAPIFDSAYFDFVDSVICSVRKIDESIPIIVQPLGWGYPDRFYTMKKFNDPFIVYSCNMYYPHQFTNEINDSTYPGYYYYRDSLIKVDSTTLLDIFYNVIEFKKKYNVPIFINEYGGRRYKKGLLKYFQDLHSIFLNNGFHFAFYIWKSEWGDTNGDKFGDYNYLHGTDVNNKIELPDNSVFQEIKRVWKK